MIYNSSHNDEKRVITKAHPNIHIVSDIYNDDWLIDYFGNNEEDSRMVYNESRKKITIMPFISSGTF